ncbi:MAG: class I SAM-dependent methyltransferase [Clostridia bacterium]
MDKTIDAVRAFYNGSAETEYQRIAGRPEFLLTSRYMARYIKPGDRVLDVGGGPGRYAHALAERGCEVTLYDLAEENVAFAQRMAKTRGLSLRAVCGDAREVDRVLEGPFDHVLLMGPLYHLLEEADRVKAVEACIRLLKPNGTFFASFIVIFAGIIYAMKFAPQILLSSDASEQAFRTCVLRQESYAGDAFTQAFFVQQAEIMPFMARFPLEKLHLFGQEGILSPCEAHIASQGPEVMDAWLDLSEAIGEREELLSWSEHLMYVGRKLP